MRPSGFSTLMEDWKGNGSNSQDPKHCQSPRRLARKAVGYEFRRLYPNERIAWTTLLADEDARYVIGVFYGSTRPPSYQFFGVSKLSGLVQQIEDDEVYRPKVWR
jgi:hypothetical protein